MLIVQADDLGLSPAVSRGILELAACGAITSTSLLANMPGSEWALGEAAMLGLDLGVHLNLVVGSPLSPPSAVQSLLRRDGSFPATRMVAWRLARGELGLAEVEREWRAQIEYLLARGVRPSHLDSHCQTHALPPLQRLAVRLAGCYGIPGVRRAFDGLIVQVPGLTGYRVRLGLPAWRGAGQPGRGAARRAVVFQPRHWTVLTGTGAPRGSRPIEALIGMLPPGCTELVTHPGHVDEELCRIDSLTTPRERDWRLLSEPGWRELLRREGIRPVSWREAACGQ